MTKTLWDPLIVQAAQADGLTPEEYLVQPAQFLRALLCYALECAPARLITCEAVPVGMPGKTGLFVKFEPELDAKEQVVFEDTLIVFCKAMGGRPPFALKSSPGVS